MIEYTVTVDEIKTEWYLNGKLHREDGPAVERTDGSKFWYINDLLHRVDGPAVENINGYKVWFINGVKHREDGPAIERPNGDNEWFLDGKKYSEKEFLEKTQPVRELSVADLEALLGYKIKIVK